jgi:hypothetical protein
LESYQDSASELTSRLGLGLRHLHDALASQVLDLLHQLVLCVKTCDIVTSADALAVDQNIGNCASARRLQERCLQLRAQRVKVELFNIGSRHDVVLLKQDSLCLLGIGAVALGEDDDCMHLSVNVYVNRSV